MTAMSPVEVIFFAALEKSTPQERAAYLAEACGDDAGLRGRVERLLAAYSRVGSFLQQPAAAPAVAAAPQEATRSAAPEQKSTEAYTGAAEQAGAVIAGRYKLLEQIGEGGMGTVWVAEQTQPVRRKVALKLIKAGMDSCSVLARFEAERQALALMDHPNIAKVLDGGTTDSGRPFFVMEYVKGVPFTTYCDDARLTVAQRLELFVPVCQAVQHAHQKGIIHRDLKPSNILICLYDGRPVPKVIDFGLAKAMHQPLTERTLHTAHGVMMGTPLYMSPEQAEFNNLDVDTRTDIYALGVILYELLTGTTPLEKQRFQKAAWQELLRLIKEEEPPRPSARLSGSGSLPSVAAQRQLEPVKLTRLVRGELDWIVMKALEKDRARRYETANGLGRDVQRYLTNEPVEAGPASRWYSFRKWVRRNGGWGTLVTTLFILVSLPTLLLWALITNLQLATVRLDYNRELQDTNDRLRILLLNKEYESLEREVISEFFSRDVLGQEPGARRPDPDLRWRTVLDRAARRLEGEAVANPAAELRMRAFLATAYEEVGEEGKAKAQRDRVLVLSRQMIEPARKALESSRETWGARHPVTLRDALRLADLCCRLQNYEEAEPLLLACYRQLEVPPSGATIWFGFGEEKEDLHEWMEYVEYPGQLAETLESLVQLYDAWGKKDQADQWRKKLGEEKAATKTPKNP
jgi:serine/threonine protein kinase